MLGNMSIYKVEYKKKIRKYMCQALCLVHVL